MSVVKLRDKRVEQLGQEFGDSFVLVAKSHLAAMDAIKDIVAIANSPLVNERVTELTKELTYIESLYTNEGVQE